MCIDSLIVTQSVGTAQWLRSIGIFAPVVKEITVPADARGKVIYGEVPLHLAAEAYLVGVVEMPGLPPERNGQDLTPEEMDAYGAELVYYLVQRVVPADDEFSELLENIGRAVLGAVIDESDLDEEQKLARRRAVIRFLKNEVAELEKMLSQDE